MTEKSTPHEMTFLEHLETLRKVLLKIIFCGVVFFIPAWIFSPHVMRFLLKLSAPPGFKLHYFTLLEPFFLQMKTALALDLVFLFPAALFLLWGFVRPGLTEREVRILRLPMLSGFFLAAAGIAFALLFIVPAVVRFSLSFSGPEMDPVIGIDSFVSMILFTAGASALVFQFPLILTGLIATGLVRVQTLKKHRPVVIVGLLVIAALLTPPDVVSQVMLFIPAYMLFEITLLFCTAFSRKKAQENDLTSSEAPDKP